MKRTLSLVLALIFVLAVFAGCAKKAEPHTLDVVKVQSVQAIADNREIDKEAFVKAFNEAKTGNVIKDSTKYSTHDLMLVITTEGTMPVFENGKNRFVVSSTLFGEAYEIESEELYKLYKGE